MELSLDDAQLIECLSLTINRMGEIFLYIKTGYESSRKTLLSYSSQHIVNHNIKLNILILIYVRLILLTKIYCKNVLTLIFVVILFNWWLLILFRNSETTEIWNELIVFLARYYEILSCANSKQIFPYCHANYDLCITDCSFIIKCKLNFYCCWKLLWNLKFVYNE